MATFTKYINTDASPGGTGDVLTPWVSMAECASANLTVSSGDTITVKRSGTAIDTSLVGGATFSGWTINGTLIIEDDATYDGVFPASYVEISNQTISTKALTLKKGIKLRNIPFLFSDVYSSGTSFGINVGPGAYLERCLMKDTSSGAGEFYIIQTSPDATGNTYLSNNIIFTPGATPVASHSALANYAAAGHVYSRHNTVIGFTYGYRNFGGNIFECINDNFDGCTDGLIGTIGTTTCLENNGNGTLSLTYANAGSDDYHLAVGDATARGQGTDVSVNANYAVTVDIDNGLRSTFDIGADEYDTAEAPTSYPTITIDGANLILDGSSTPYSASTGWEFVVFEIESPGTIIGMSWLIELEDITIGGVTDGEVVLTLTGLSTESATNVAVFYYNSVLPAWGGPLFVTVD